MCSHRVWSGISLNPGRTFSAQTMGQTVWPRPTPVKSATNYVKSIFHLLLIYNHAVADGISGVILTNQILENYSKLQKNETLDMTCTRVKTIGELKSDEMPNGHANIQKLTDYANKVSDQPIVPEVRSNMWSFASKWVVGNDSGQLWETFFRKTKNSKITWQAVLLIQTKKRVLSSDKDLKRAFKNSNS